MKKAIFLDRDGVLNADDGYVWRLDALDIIEDTVRFLTSVSSDYYFFIITNQSGIARGYYSVSDMQSFNLKLIGQLINFGVKILDIEYCPHLAEDNCSCRKPKPGMILNLRNKWNIDLSRSVLIGDKCSDIAAGKNAGIGTNILKCENANCNHFDNASCDPDIVIQSCSELDIRKIEMLNER